MKGKELIKFEKGMLERVKSLSDQSKSAVELISFFISILESTVNRSERNIILNLIRELRQLPKLSDIELKEISDKVQNLEGHVSENEKLVEGIQNVVKYIEDTFEMLSELLKKIDKIHFDEGQGFLWKVGNNDNIDKLANLSESITKLKKKGINIYSDRDETNDDVLKLYEHLNIFSNDKRFQELGNLGQRFSYNVGLFFNVHSAVLGLLSDLKSSSEWVKQARAAPNQNSAVLNNPDVSRRLNYLINEVRKSIIQVLQKREIISKELKLILYSSKQVTESLLNDKRFLINLLKPGLSTSKKNNEVCINDPYYIEARSNHSFFKPEYHEDSTGTFSKEESKFRLFEQEPRFSNKQFYSMSDDVSGLIDSFIRGGDNMFSDYKGYIEELIDLAKRSPKLDPNIMGALIIPAYMEEKAIQKTLEKYSHCNGFEKIAVFIFENMPAGTRRDLTITRVQLFKMNYPNVKVYHIFKSFKDKMPIGYIRKYITEYVLLLKHYSRHPGNIILIGGDADCIDVSQDFFSSILSSFLTNPYLDAVEMKMDFPIHYRITYPNLWVMHRIFDFAWMYMRHKINPNQAIRMYGPASAIKASSYMLIKGYNPRTRICEDLQISWLLDEGRRGADNTQKYFSYLGARVVTNPRRAISAYLSKVSHLDMYDSFSENDKIRNIGWEDLIENEKAKGVLIVGNTYSISEIRNAIKKHKSSNIAITLAYGLQRYVDWWKYKVENSKWLNKLEFEDMLKRVMDFIGIDFEITYAPDFWNFTILNIDRLEENMNKMLNAEKNRNSGIVIDKLSIDLKTYKRTASKEKQKPFMLLILGHTSGFQGEVTTGIKLLELARSHGLNAELLDIFDLLPRGQEREMLTSLLAINTDKAYQGLVDTNPEDNAISIFGNKRMAGFYNKYDVVVLFSTTPYNQLGLAKIGFSQHAPVIAWYYPYTVKNEPLYRPYFMNSTIVTSYSPLGAQGLLSNGVPAERIVIVPMSYSNLADKAYSQIQNSDHMKGKKAYIDGIAANMKKKVKIDEKTIVFGVFSRIIDRYNQVFILKCLKEIGDKLDNFLFVLKSPPPKDSEGGNSGFYSDFYKLIEQLKDKSWFLWDTEFTKYDMLYSIYSYLDVAIFMTGAGQAAVEQSALGTTLLLLDTPYNKSLYSDMAYFVACDSINEETDISHPNARDFMSKVMGICNNRGTIKGIRQNIRAMAERRFGPEIAYSKLKLAIDASRGYYYNKNAAQYKSNVAKELGNGLSRK